LENVEQSGDILVQQLKKSFELSQFSAQLVQTANFLGYFWMAIPVALLMRRWGYKAGMVTGLVLFGGGMSLFWPAAVSGRYVPFLLALFAVGCGASMRPIRLWRNSDLIKRRNAG
jgi:FHS family L-fucose permease-like MFS transporter